MKADLAIYAHVLGVPGQYKSVALMLSHRMDFHCRANRNSFRKSSHVLHVVLVLYFYACTVFQLLHMQWLCVCVCVFLCLYCFPITAHAMVVCVRDLLVDIR